MLKTFKFKQERSLLKSIVYLVLPAKVASSGPPIGPILGQCGIPAAPFCKDFNERSKIFMDATYVRVKIYLFINGEYNFDILLPSDYFFIKKMLNISKGSSKPGHLLSDNSFDRLFRYNKKPKQKYITPYMLYEYLLYKKNNNIIEQPDIFSSFLKTSHSTKSIGIKIYTDVAI